MEEQVEVRDLPVTEGDTGVGHVEVTEDNKDQLPGWAANAVPEGLTLPTDGQTIFIMKLEARLTARKKREDRTVVVWELSLRDERNARSRAAIMGDNNGLYDEFAKGMIRAIDGKPVDWTKGGGAMDQFWDEIGPRFRGYLVGWYVKSHQMSDEERLRFFAQSVVPRTTG
jgi:hypothetical protein